MSYPNWLSNITSENEVICTLFELITFSGFCLSIYKLIKNLINKLISFAYLLISRARVERLSEKLICWLSISPYGEIRKRQSMRIALGG